MRRPALTIGLLAAVAGVVIAGAIAFAALGSNSEALTEMRLDAISREASGFAFAPDPLPIPARRPVSITFHNTTDAPHTLILLDPIGVGTRDAVPAGGTVRVDFVAPGPGTYRFVCNVHDGMTGTLEVR